MKTPQEEAEEMAAKCASAIWGGNPSSEIGRGIVSNDQLAILKNIPLAELIAVARAANQRQRATTHAEQVNTDTLLNDALIALRATGKVDL